MQNYQKNKASGFRLQKSEKGERKALFITCKNEVYGDDKERKPGVHTESEQSNHREIKPA